MWGQNAGKIGIMQQDAKANKIRLLAAYGGNARQALIYTSERVFTAISSSLRFCLGSLLRNTVKNFFNPIPNGIEERVFEGRGCLRCMERTSPNRSPALIASGLAAKPRVLVSAPSCPLGRVDNQHCRAFPQKNRPSTVLSPQGHVVEVGRPGEGNFFTTSFFPWRMSTVPRELLSGRSPLKISSSPTIPAGRGAWPFGR